MMYVPTHTRGSPYFIGMAFGYLTFLSNTQKFQLSQVQTKNLYIYFVQKFSEAEKRNWGVFVLLLRLHWPYCVCFESQRELAGLINFFWQDDKKLARKVSRLSLFQSSSLSSKCSLPPSLTCRDFSLSAQRARLLWSNKNPLCWVEQKETFGPFDPPNNPLDDN